MVLSLRRFWRGNSRLLEAGRWCWNEFDLAESLFLLDGIQNYNRTGSTVEREVKDGEERMARD